MPSASILTKADEVVSNGGVSAATINVNWNLETKYLDAAYDFFDAGTSTRNLVIPAGMTGSLYEVFLWIEDAAETWDNSGGGMYLGLLSSAIPGWASWWGIYADVGKASRGCRTGLLEADANEGSFFSQVREFESADMTASASKCRFGILEGNPNPLAMAAGLANTGFSCASGEDVLAFDEEYDIGGVYNEYTGTYTTPPGATLAVFNANGYITSENITSDFAWELHKNGSEYAKFRHAGSGRGFGPGTFGLMPVVAGDTFEIRTQNDAGFARTMQEGCHSVEFY